MPITRNGKQYYTIDESKERLSKYIKNSANELAEELPKNSNNKEKVHV